MQVTTEQYIQRLHTMYGVQGNLVSMVLQKPAYELLKSIKRRIQKEGQNSDGGQIGRYSTRPIYVTRKDFAHPSAFQPDSTTVTYVPYVRGGKARMRKQSKKTMYLPRGYKQLRDIQDMQTEFVDATYTGKTMKAYQLEMSDNEILLGLTTGKASLVRERLEAGFKARIFPATRTEIDTYKNKVNFSLERITRGVLEGKLSGAVLTPDYSFSTETNLPF